MRHPTVEIAPPEDAAALARAVALLEGCDLAIFVSPTAVQEALRSVPKWPAGVGVAAVGPGTKAALARRGFASVLAPHSGADSEALLAEPRLQQLRGQRVLIFRGAGGRELLAEALAARGAEVCHAVCYRRVKPHADFSPLAARWARSGLDAVTVFSSSALDNLFVLLPPAAHALVAATPVFASHPRIAQHAHRRGVREVIVSGPGDDDMLAELLAYFGGRK